MFKEELPYEFGDNSKLKQLIEAWRRHKDYGTYILTGPSGCGKTLLLRELQKELEKSEYLTGEAVLDKIFECIKEQRMISLPINEQSQVIFIDMLDVLKGRRATQEEFVSLLHQYSNTRNGEKRLVICTFEDKKLAELFAKRAGFPLVSMEHVRPNKRLSENYERALIYKLILTSKGLNTAFGTQLMKDVVEKERLSFVNKKIFLLTFPQYEVDEKVVNACKELGFAEANIYKTADFEGKSIDEMPDVDVLYATEGNVFEMLSYLRLYKFDLYAKRIMEKNGSIYIGSSAGAAFASSDVKLAEYFDRNFSQVKNYEGFALLPGTELKADTIIPHYTLEQCEQFVEKLSEAEKDKYETIHNISNEEALIMDMRKKGTHRELVRKKQMKL